jgi:hypothetical protein
VQCFEAATVPSDPFLKKSSEYLKIILDTVTQERYSVLAVEEEHQMKEIVLYGIPKGKTGRIDEVILLTNCTQAKLERVYPMAKADGFHSFRTAVIDLSQVPDFAGTVNV